MPHLVQIGNSRGVRIPRPLIEQARLEGVELELEATNEGLLIRRKHRARAGWRDAFEGRQAGDADEPTMDAFGNAFDVDEWQW
jgi:antitoxin MazE